MFISKSIVNQCQKEMGLQGSASTMKTMDLSAAEQLVVKVVDKDPAKCSGVQTIHQRIAFDNGIYLIQYGDVFLTKYFSHVPYCVLEILSVRSCIHMTVMHLQPVNQLPSASFMSKSIQLESMHTVQQMVLMSSTRLVSNLGYC